MFWASSWQWRRYHEKTALIQTYESDAKITPVPFPTSSDAPGYKALIDRRVRVQGTYDFDRQVIVTNRTGSAGPGHWLLTPFRLKDSELSVIVSRGYIPFDDRSPEAWTRYDFADVDSFDAVVKRSAEQFAFGPRNPEVGGSLPFQRIFYFPEITKIAKQLPYAVIPDIYLQRIGGPPVGSFPEQSILVEVPPSTHFGYTFEWILLGLVTLTLGFAFQAFPRRRAVSSPMTMTETANGHLDHSPH